MKLNFSGNRVLITGGTCDLAVTLAKLTAETGLYPILTARTEKGLADIDEVMKPFSGKFETALLDFADQSTLVPLFDQIKDDLDYMVDFAHTDYERLVASADPDASYKYFEENLAFRSALISRSARTMLKKKRGRMVYISSSAAISPNPGQGFYASAKLASEALYKNIGLELGSRGITTVSLRPGYINAGRGKDFINKNEKSLFSRIPIKRALGNKEVAETILFFLSDSATGFNAVEITFDGGLSAGK